MVMNEPVDAPESPSVVAHLVSHLLIGVAVGSLAKAVFRQQVAVALTAGLIAAAAHYNFDAPLARKLSELGI
jgi:uncharacterized protein (DUF697 family)